MPLCTVTLPVHKSPCLQIAIDSILAQTFTDFIFLIGIDGEDPDAIALLNTYSDPRIKVVQFEHSGFIHTVDKLARMVTTEFWARMDHDDFSHPERLEKLIGILQQKPELAGICSDYGYYTTNHKLVIYNDSQLSRKIDLLTAKDTLINSRRISDTSSVYRTACTKAVDYYDTNVNFEQPLQIKLIERFGYAIIDYPLHFATFSLNSVSRASKQMSTQDKVLRYLVSNYGDVEDKDTAAQILANESKAMPKWLRLSIRKMRMELAAKNYKWLYLSFFDEKRSFGKWMYWKMVLNVLLGKEKTFKPMPGISATTVAALQTK